MSLQFVEPQRKVADLIVPRGIENRVALGKLIDFCIICHPLMLNDCRYDGPVH